MSEPITITVIGGGRLARALRRAGGSVEGVVSSVLYQGAEAIVTESKERFVPVRWGALRASGHTLRPVTKAGVVEVAMGFGGPSAPYAWRQHENLAYHHTVGQAKYLEKPTLERVPEIRREVEREVAKAVGAK